LAIHAFALFREKLAALESKEDEH